MTWDPWAQAVSPSLKVAARRQSSSKPQVNILYIILLTKINIAFLFTLSPPFLPLCLPRSLIMFMCPRQTHVLRMHHTELRSAFDVPLITSSAKPKTFTLWVRGKEIELTSWAILFEYGRKTAIRMNSSGGEVFALKPAVAQRKGDTVLFVSCLITTLKLLLVCWRTWEMDEQAEKCEHKWLQMMRNF